MVFASSFCFLFGPCGASFLPPEGRGATARARHRSAQLLACGTDTRMASSCSIH
jgi:hypothetical protein